VDAGDARTALIARSAAARRALLPSLLVTKLASSLLHSANIYSHSVMKETRLARWGLPLRRPSLDRRMRAQLFQHTLAQEMAFFDSRTVGDIAVSCVIVCRI
jgi:hypothetical protein